MCNIVSGAFCGKCMTSVRYAICELKVACGTAGTGCRIVRIC
jgi:hypothetical protein